MNCAARWVLDFRVMSAPSRLTDDLRIFRAETDLGTVVSFGGQWFLYTSEGMFVRGLSERESRELNDELLYRSLPRGEDR